METALYQLSEHDKDLGRTRDQVDLLQRLLRLDPRHERALNNLGIARYRLGEPPEDLLAGYRALVAMNPKNARALQNYGFLLIEAGRPAEAVAALEQAVAIDPAYCTALNNLGRAQLGARRQNAGEVSSSSGRCPATQNSRNTAANLGLAR